MASSACVQCNRHAIWQSELEELSLSSLYHLHCNAVFLCEWEVSAFVCMNPTCKLCAVLPPGSEATCKLSQQTGRPDM